MGNDTTHDNLRLLEPQLQIGKVTNIFADTASVNLDEAKRLTPTRLRGSRHGLGEVGEFVLIESDGFVLLAHIVECRIPERERLTIDGQPSAMGGVHPIGIVRFLGSFDPLNDSLRPGVVQYPRLGARVFSAPHQFIARIPSLIDGGKRPKSLTLHLGSVKSATDSPIQITPERFFGRHAAVLGTTGGGKSYSVARLIGECLKHKSKIILLDPTGEYQGLTGPGVQHIEILGSQSLESCEACIGIVPPTEMTEEDFLALFQPSGKAQAPLMREAIRSLRLAMVRPDLASDDGLIIKAERSKKDLALALKDPTIARQIEDPKCPFNVFLLKRQIEQECVHQSDFKDPTKWGQRDLQSLSWCQPLLVRITRVISSVGLASIFNQETKGTSSLFEVMTNFLADGDSKVIRISLEFVSFEYQAREIIANIIGRWLIQRAREYKFIDTPLIIFLDEAHQFLNKAVGDEELLNQLDSFELIAKEGRKYGLVLCLATQRPRDLPQGVLSQMGTLLVHRLTNDRDRELVERACGEIDRSVSAFLPNLQPGEAALIGVDFPIPMTIQVGMPAFEPNSKGPSFQAAWSREK